MTGACINSFQHESLSLTVKERWKRSRNLNVSGDIVWQLKLPPKASFLSSSFQLLLALGITDPPVCCQTRPKTPKYVWTPKRSIKLHNSGSSGVVNLHSVVFWVWLVTTTMSWPEHSMQLQHAFSFQKRTQWSQKKIWQWAKSSKECGAGTL